MSLLFLEGTVKIGGGISATVQGRKGNEEADPPRRDN